MATKSLISDRGTFLTSPRRGYHYAIDWWNTMDRDLYIGPNDPTPRFPLFLIPGIESISTFPFKWKELMPETDALLKGLSPLLTYETNIKEAGEADDKAKPQKMAFVQRYNADQYFLTGREVHAFFMDVLTDDSVPVRLIFTFMINPKSLKKIYANYPLGNFLDVAETDLIEELAGVLRGKPFKELRKVAHGSLKEIIETVKNAINKVFGSQGFLLMNVGLKAILTTPELAQRIAAENGIKIAESEGKQMEERSKGEAKAIENKGTAEASVLGKKLSEQAAYETKVRALIDQTKVQIATNLKATTLVTAENLFGENKTFTNLLVADTVARGGRNNGN